MRRFKFSCRNRKKKYFKYCSLFALGFISVHAFFTLAYTSTYLIQNQEREDAFYFGTISQTTSGSEKTTIPRIVHQMWKTNEIPEQWDTASKSWKITNPSILYMFWNDTLLERFISSSYPWLLDLYRSYPYNIQRADMARYVILFHFGGVYADLDIECKTSLDSIFFEIDNKNFAIAVAPTTPFGFSNDLIFARAKSNFLKRVVLGLRSSNRWYYLPYLTVMFSTGSFYYSTMVEQYVQKGEIYIIPKDCYNHLCFQHLAGGSWHSLDGKIIWFTYTMLLKIHHTIITMAALFISFVICCLLIILCLKLLRKISRHKF